MIVGYARVSTTDQTLAVQNELLLRAGAKHIFGERYTGKTRVGRGELDKCLASLKAGDTLLVVRLDRLARSLMDLWTILKDLEARGVGFRCLTQPIDTTTPVGRFTISILGAAAEFELDMLKERRAEGIERAKRAGKYLGRKAKGYMPRARELRAEGLSATAIRAQIERETGDPITVRTVYRMTRGMWKEAPCSKA